MKHLERFLRYIFWVVVTASIAWIVKKAFERAAKAERAEDERVRVESIENLPKTKALVRDRVCGTYVAEDISYVWKQGGESLHFCSRDCMEHYQAANRLAAGV